MRLNLRLILALLTLAVVAAVCIALGNWQLQRASARDAAASAIASGQRSSALVLEADTPPQELIEWRNAVATGHWLSKFTILLGNRNHNGQPGFWLTTPLQLQDGTSVLVLRGWLAQPLSGQLPAITSFTDRQTIEGRLIRRAPRVLELWSFSGRGASHLPKDFGAVDGPLAQVQNIDLEEYAQASGLQLLPVLLEQTSPDTSPLGASLVRDWPLPRTDSDTNRGYALQWFGFATIALFAWLGIIWHTWRKYRSSPKTP